MRRSSSLAGFSQTSNSKQMKRNFSVAVGKEKQKDSTMKSSLKTALVVVTLALPFPAASLADALTITGYPTSVTVSIIQSVESSQQKVTAGEQLNSQLVGAWKLVLMDGVKADGTRQPRFGPNPIGSLIFTPNGGLLYSLCGPTGRSSRPTIAIPGPLRRTRQQYRAHCPFSEPIRSMKSTDLLPCLWRAVRIRTSRAERKDFVAPPSPMTY
jgi:hypothetical protein